MGQKSSRGWRRHHKRRMGDKAVAVYYWMSPDRARRLADHLSTCSGPCCGNPHRHFGHRKLGEIRQLMRERDEH